MEHIGLVCNSQIEIFFSTSINDYEVDNELKELVESLPKDKNIIEFIKK